MRDKTLHDVVIAVDELPGYLAEICAGIELLCEAVEPLNRDIVHKLGTVMMYSGE